MGGYRITLGNIGLQKRCGRAKNVLFDGRIYSLWVLTKFCVLVNNLNSLSLLFWFTEQIQIRLSIYLVYIVPDILNINTFRTVHKSCLIWNVEIPKIASIISLFT